MICRYNLGHHMLPSNKFLLYDHSLRIPMVIMGPGIEPNSANEFFGTQVDLAPTMLGLAGIPTPSYMDGKSIVSVIVEPALPASSADSVPGAVLKHLRETGAPPKRVASFHEYYNQVSVNLFQQARLMCVLMYCCHYMILKSRGHGKLVAVIR